MTDHVIECRWESHRCICEELRACEKRIKQSITGLSWYSKARWTGYYEGIDAAREAVAALRPKQDGWHPDGDAVLRLALAAIDALKKNNET